MTNSWDAALNAANKQKGINAGRGPGADAFCCCVSLGGRRG